MGAAARRSGRRIARSFHRHEEQALLAASDAIRAQNNAILAANDEECGGRGARSQPGVVGPLETRCKTYRSDGERRGRRRSYPTPWGASLRAEEPNGLDIARMATPIGVIGIIYESGQCDGGCRRAVLNRVMPWILRGGRSRCLPRPRSMQRWSRAEIAGLPRPRSNSYRRRIAPRLATFSPD